MKKLMGRFITFWLLALCKDNMRLILVPGFTPRFKVGALNHCSLLLQSDKLISLVAGCHSVGPTSTNFIPMQHMRTCNKYILQYYIQLFISFNTPLSCFSFHLTTPFSMAVYFYEGCNGEIKHLK